MTRYFTPEGLEKLKKELDNLENVKRKELAEKLRHAISFGDLKENAAYHEAKEAQGFLEGRILELKGIIAGAELIKKTTGDKIQLGSTVLLVSKGGEEEYQIVGQDEADILKNKISSLSPLGKVLLGREKGDNVKIKTPDGEVEYRITEIKQ